MDKLLAEASESLGVRQVAQLLEGSGVLRADGNLAPHNLVIADDNRSWSDNGSVRCGSAADLVSVLQGCSATEAAQQWLAIIGASSAEERRSMSPECAEGGLYAAEPPFPAECLPQLLREMACAIAEMEDVPPVLAAGAVIGATSASLGRGIVIQSKNDKVAPGNLYLVLEAESDSGKSGTTERAIAPLLKFEQELQTKHGRELSRAAARLSAIDAKLKAEHLKAARESPSTDGEFDRVAAMHAEKLILERQIEPPTLLTGDVTTERMIQLMEVNGTLASLTGEGRGPAQVLCGYYSRS